MPVTEKHMGRGGFTVNFSQEFTPTEIVESIQEWGHIIITPQEIDIKTLTDAEIKNLSSYTGIVLNRILEEGVVSIEGQGLALYLGDGQGKGMVIAESNNIGKVRNYTGTTLAETLFNSTAQTNKPLGIMRDEAGNLQAITQGTINNPTGTYTGSHFVETAYSALQFISEVLSTEFRVNMNGTLDAGPAANLFEGVGTAQPKSIVVKTAYGQDPEMEGVVPLGLKTEFDAMDWVSRVDFIGEVGYFDVATDVAGEANLSSNPYKDLHGNALKRVGLVQEPAVPENLLNLRAQTILNELSRVKKVLNLDLEQYEVTGDMKVGDFIYAFDPDIGFVDTATEATAESRSLYEIAFRGQNINPVKVRVKGITYPIRNGMGCYFRDKDGNYTDLTPYVQYESGSAQIMLGDSLRTIGDDLRFSEHSLSRVQAGVFSIPNLPSTPTLQAGSYLDTTGVSKGFVRVVVSRPTNVDGSQITDGHSYTVRYKKTTDSQYSYASFPYTGVATESLLIQDLTIGATYQVGVNVVDKSGFKKMSAYDGTGEDLYTDSSSVNANFATNARVEIDKDGQAPSKPKTAQAIAAGPLKVQVTHLLGKAGTDGNGNPYGNYTLEGDLDFLAVHAVTQSGNSANFTVSSSNKIGEIRVTAGNLLQQIPLVGDVNLADSSGHYFRFVAVDKSGNASDPSDGQTATANLITESYIADATITTAKIGTAQITDAKIADATITNAKIANLSADKINAGTISADRIGANSITAAKIASDTITATQTASGTITSTEIASGTITTGQLNFTPATSSDLANYVTISSTSAGTLDIVADDVQVTGNLSATGTITANAGFVDGTAITPSQVDSAVNMDEASTLTDNFTLSGSGKIRTSASGARVEMTNTSGVGVVNFYEGDGGLTMSMQAGTDAFTMSGGTDDNVTISTVTNKQFKIVAGEIVLETTNDELKLDLAGPIKLGVDPGTAGEVLTSGGPNAAPSWQGSGSHADSDHNSFAASSHSHSYATTNHSHNYANANHGHNYSNLSLGNTSNTASAGDHAHNSSSHNHNAYSSVTHTHVHGNSVHNVDYAAESYVNGQITSHLFSASHSDERIKENITDTSLGLDFIKNLKPRDFTWKDTYLDSEYSDDNTSESKYKTLISNTQQGFVAQEVKTAVFDTTGSNTSFGGLRIGDITDSDKTLSSDADDFGRVDYVQIIAPLVKAVQELSAKIDVLDARIDELESA